MTLIVKDQYGDPFEGSVNFTVPKEVFANTTAKDKIADIVNIFTANEKGEVTLTINPTDKTGSGSFIIKNSTNTSDLLTIALNTSNVAEATSIKFEKADSKKDNTLDVYADSDDKTVVYNINEYNGSYKVGTAVATDISTESLSESMKYSVVSSDKSIASVTASGSNITIEGKKKGTATIRVYKGKTQETYITVTVNDSTPTISKIDFRNVETITKSDVTDVLPLALDMTQLGVDDYIIGGITLTGKGGDVKLAYDEDTKETLLKVNETTVGKIKVTSNTDNIIVGEKNVITYKSGVTTFSGKVTVAVYTKRNSPNEIDLNSSPLTKTIEFNVTN